VTAGAGDEESGPAPFPPVPDAIAKGTLAINGEFRYEIER
jgi:hypothetical protein